MSIFDSIKHGFEKAGNDIKHTAEKAGDDFKEAGETIAHEASEVEHPRFKWGEE